MILFSYDLKELTSLVHTNQKCLGQISVWENSVLSKALPIWISSRLSRDYPPVLKTIKIEGTYEFNNLNSYVTSFSTAVLCDRNSAHTHVFPYEINQYITFIYNSINWYNVQLKSTEVFKTLKFKIIDRFRRFNWAKIRLKKIWLSLTDLQVPNITKRYEEENDTPIWLFIYDNNTYTLSKNIIYKNLYKNLYTVLCDKKPDTLKNYRRDMSRVNLIASENLSKLCEDYKSQKSSYSCIYRSVIYNFMFDCDIIKL